MKKSIKSLIPVLILMAAGGVFTACSDSSDDDDDPPVVNQPDTNVTQPDDTEKPAEAKSLTVKFTRKNDKFKGEIHNNMESDKTIKRISAEFTSDTDGIDLNFFIKPVDWNNYVKPNNKDGSCPKTKKESSVTVTTYDFPASGTKFTVNEDNTGDALFSKDNNIDNVATANGPFKAIGFEAAYYGEGGGYTHNCNYYT